MKNLQKTVEKRRQSSGSAIKHDMKRQKKTEFASGKYESLDYEFMETEHLRHMDAGLKGNKLLLESHTRIVYWILVILIGICMGVVAYLMTLILSEIMHWKYNTIQEFMSKGETNNAYGFHIGVIIFFISFASLMANLSPVSAGSGIPVVKAYLNGNYIKGMLRWETFLAKFFGCMSCVTAGMPAGREGPMVHLGAIVSAFLARGESRLFPTGFECFHFNTFDNAKDMRDFVSIGAAAGVAAAFNAPVGGVLFSLEEVSSFWTGKHMFAVFIGAAVASTTLNMIRTAQHGGKTADEGLILFGQSGEFEEFSFTDFHYWELLIFAAIGVMGGILGGIFCFCNKKLTVKRKAFYASMEAKYATTKDGNTARFSPARLKCILTIMESALTLFVVGTIFFWLPLGFDCRATSEVADAHILAESTIHGLQPIRHNCEGDAHHPVADGIADGIADDHRLLSGAGGVPPYFNDMATLIFNPQESVAKQLFSRSTAGFFRIKTLATFAAVYFPCACYCYGLFVPAGLFVPSLISGAAIGRLIGEVLVQFVTDKVDPGMYALIGAGAVLAGITRMTISLAVILVELTNDINFLLPILITLVFAKSTGDFLAESIYDIHIELSGVPFLEPNPPDDMNFRVCQDAMKPNPICFNRIEELSVLKSTLESCSHNAFPIVDPGRTGHGRHLVGIATREMLQMLVDQTDVHKSSGTPSVAAATDAAMEAADAAARTLHFGKPRFDANQPTQGSIGSSSAVVSTGVSEAPPSAAAARSPRRPSVMAIFKSSSSNFENLDGSAPPSSTRSGSPKSPAIKRSDTGSASVRRNLKDAVDLDNSIDPSPFVVQEALPLSRAYRLFTKMGLRHLVVVGMDHSVAGIMTRKDFAFGHDTPLREITENISVRYVRDTALRNAQANVFKRVNSSRYSSPRPRATSF
jgi:chloride channel 7